MLTAVSNPDWSLVYTNRKSVSWAQEATQELTACSTTQVSFLTSRKVVICVLCVSFIKIQTSETQDQHFLGYL